LQKVQYLNYARFSRISHTAKYAAFFKIEQALILNFLQSRLIETFYDALIFVCFIDEKDILIMRTCVSPKGNFIWAVHKPSFSVKNLRQKKDLTSLGIIEGNGSHDNHANFPEKDIRASNADPVFEISNAFPFRGVTYINTRWADENATDPVGRIRLPGPEKVSFSPVISACRQGQPVSDKEKKAIFKALAKPLRLALAETGTDPDDLVVLACMACDFVFDPGSGLPQGLVFSKQSDGRIRPKIYDGTLFEVIANNPHLPEVYREAMVLRPGVQGANPVVGEYISPQGSTHVYEYLRANSYIPWGHYAANMAEDSIRYSVDDLGAEDMRGMRHLYYQRTYVRLAQDLGIETGSFQKTLTQNQLETLRLKILGFLADEEKRRALTFNRTLWGWNYGFDFAPTKYRLHASHQQIHQQYAMIPKNFEIQKAEEKEITPYAIGDLVADFVSEYRKKTGTCFFNAYLAAIENNRRIKPSENGEHSLVIYSDENVIAFVPKAQTSQWELQVMSTKQVGNILEADIAMRNSLDTAILTAAKALSSLGAKMITFYEISTRIDIENNGQRLLYVLLPRLPESPGAFSESQLRWINGHYPEDFATACRAAME
jgi:hypothetical protein